MSATSRAALKSGVFGEKFLLNVGVTKTADKAVAKGLREIFPKLTSGSQWLEVGRDFNSDTLSFSVCLQL